MTNEGLNVRVWDFWGPVDSVTRIFPGGFVHGRPSEIQPYPKGNRYFHRTLKSR